MTTGASPFQPVATVTMAASTVSVNVQLAGSGASLLITNPTASLAYVKFGADPALQATATDMPILPNSRILIQCGTLVTYCAAILAVGSGAVLVTRGHGSNC
jgi:hypothetical protein